MPSIRTAQEEHDRYCNQPEGGWLGDMKPEKDASYPTNWGSEGDVRICVHGKVMLGVEVPGMTPCYWRTLSRIWTPFLYRRAMKVLKED